MPHLPNLALSVLLPLVLVAFACNGRSGHSVAGAKDGEPSSFVVVNLLETPVNRLVLEYGADPLRFPDIPIESGETATRGRVQRLPLGGEMLRVGYSVLGEAVEVEAAVPTRPRRGMVPVAVLLASGVSVEWHDAEDDVFDVSEQIKRRHGYSPS